MIQINFEAGNEFKMTSSAENKVQNFFESILSLKLQARAYRLEAFSVLLEPIFYESLNFETSLKSTCKTL